MPPSQMRKQRPGLMESLALGLGGRARVCRQWFVLGRWRRLADVLREVRAGSGVGMAGQEVP